MIQWRPFSSPLQWTESSAPGLLWLAWPVIEREEKGIRQALGRERERKHHDLMIGRKSEVQSATMLEIGLGIRIRIDRLDLCLSLFFSFFTQKRC